MEIRKDAELPPITGRGRQKGVGVNLHLLSSLQPGETVWDVPKKKMMSIISSANVADIKLIVRRIPNTTLYAFKINHESQDSQVGG